jgi:hypothetical protein
VKTLATIRGTAVQIADDVSVSFRAGITIDADGSPRAYAPAGSGLRGLDHLANAGRPGNWWGIATSEHGPYIQGEDDPRPGFYVSTTSYQRRGFDLHDPRRYLDSEQVPFIVVPAQLRRMVAPIVLGCRALVTDLHTGKEVAAIVGDFGPATHLGEGSIALALELGINADPRTGGIDEARFLYTFWPGHEATLHGERFELIAST